MSRILVCALLLALVSPAWSQSTSQTAQQQAETAAQQSQTALQQSQTALQQSQKAQTGMTEEEKAALKDKQAERLREARDVMRAALNEKTGISKGLTDK